MDGKKSDVDPDPSLDFLSAKFDPLLALRVVSTDIRLPYPDVQACYSLDAYKSIMRARGSGRPARHAAPPEASDELVLPERKEKPAKAVKTVLTYMQSCTTGPLSLVQRCYANRERVCVMIRHCAGVRGQCEGIIVAFDKHLNLVLGDVYEEYSPLKTVSNGGKVLSSRNSRAKAKRRLKRKMLFNKQAQPPSDTKSCVVITDDPLSSSEGVGRADLHVLSTVAATDRTTMPSPCINNNRSIGPDSQESFQEQVEPACRTSEPGSTSGRCKEESDDDEVGDSGTTMPVAVDKTPSSTVGADQRLSRCVKQLFVRGDNVVLISTAAVEGEMRRGAE